MKKQIIMETELSKKGFLETLWLLIIKKFKQKRWYMNKQCFVGNELCTATRNVEDTSWPLKTRQCNSQCERWILQRWRPSNEYYTTFGKPKTIYTN